MSLCVRLKSLSGFYDNSALAISQRLWSDRCAFRTDRRKTREPLSGLSNIVGVVEYIFLCAFLFILQIWNWLFPPQKHWNEGKPEEELLKALVKCGAVLYRRSPFLLLQPVMSDHGLLTTVAYKLGRDKPAFYALEVFQSPQLCRCSVCRL